MSRTIINFLGGDEPRVQIRRGRLRFNPSLPRPGAAGGDPPEPSDCCSEPPGDRLLNAIADLKLFFDKWYGEDKRSTESGYYLWDDSDCRRIHRPPRVPTETLHNTLVEDLCANHEAWIDLVNTLRDAVVTMSAVGIARRPSWGTGDECDVECPDTAEFFEPVFSTGRHCTQDPVADCVPTGTMSQLSRLSYNQRACVHHYDEIEDQVDEMMTDGVVWLRPLLETRAPSPCGLEEASVCAEIHTIDYEESATFSDDSFVEDDPMECCYGPDSVISNFTYLAVDWTEAFDLGTCSDSDCWTQSPGCRTLNDPSDLVENPMIGKATYLEQNGGGSRLDCFPHPRWSLTAAGNGRTTVRACQVNFCTILFDDTGPVRADVFIARRNTGARVEWAVTVDITQCGVRDDFGDPHCLSYSILGEGPCSGHVSLYDITCSNDGAEVHFQGARCEFDVTAGSFGTPCSCDDISVTCPGDETNEQTVNSSVSLVSGPFPYRRRVLFANGSGSLEEQSLSMEVKLRACPAAGVVNAVMADPRLPTSYSNDSWGSATAEAPALGDPECPENVQTSCSPFCLTGYGELA